MSFSRQGPAGYHKVHDVLTQALPIVGAILLILSGRIFPVVSTVVRVMVYMTPQERLVALYLFAEVFALFIPLIETIFLPKSLFVGFVQFQ